MDAGAFDRNETMAEFLSRKNASDVHKQEGL
jgi:hypothetical protein